MPARRHRPAAVALAGLAALLLLTAGLAGLTPRPKPPEALAPTPSPQPAPTAPQENR